MTFLAFHPNIQKTTIAYIQIDPFYPYFLRRFRVTIGLDNMEHFATA